MWMIGHQATTRRKDYVSGEVPAGLAEAAQAWGIDPKPTTRAAPATSGQRLSRPSAELGPDAGYTSYETMTDQQLVDYFHCTLFPNLTLTMSPEQCQILRTEPHPTDPEKCVFQHWCLYPPVEKMKEVIHAGRRWPPAPRRDHAAFSTYGDGVSVGYVADQDLSIGTTQQQGLNSRGFKGCILPGQEKRVQRFHERLNDFVLNKD
jgi:hypothetical protein